MLDILLPNLDGLTIAKRLRDNPLTKKIPIIILTVLAQGEPTAEALEAGVYEYLVKSNYKIEEIVAKVKEKLI